MQLFKRNISTLLHTSIRLAPSPAADCADRPVSSCCCSGDEGLGLGLNSFGISKACEKVHCGCAAKIQHCSRCSVHQTITGLEAAPCSMLRRARVDRAASTSPERSSTEKKEVRPEMQGGAMAHLSTLRIAPESLQLHVKTQKIAHLCYQGSTRHGLPESLNCH